MTNKDYYFSICAIVKNEELYLEEWLQYHRTQGVEHFYLTDNGSTDNTLDIIYNSQDITVRIDESTPVQFKAYQYMIDNHKKDTEWCAFIDIDEFLVSNNRDNFVEAFKLYDRKETSVLAIYWLLFGSAGQKKYTPYPVLERFIRCAVWCDKHVKSIVRMEDAISVGNNPHTFRVTNKIKDENGVILPVEYAIQPDPDKRSASDLAIHHYHTKSIQEYMNRKILGDPGSGKKHTNEKIIEMFFAHDCNAIRNLKALK